MNYSFYSQERDNWCFPACLQSVLESRGFSVSQESIAEKLQVTKDGLHLSESVLSKFLLEYNLKFSFNNYFLGGLEPDLLLSKELNDNTNVLVAYDYLKLHELGKGGKHVSIVVEYNRMNDKVGLLDSSQGQVVTVSLPSLCNSIQAKEDSRYGFYIVSQGTLANL